MQKIVITINDETLLFKYKQQSSIPKDDLMNTNIINNNELSFSPDYIEKNSKIVGLFIKELINEKNINKLVINKFDMFKILKESLKLIDNVPYLYISDEANFTFESYEIILDLKKFKYINCYSIPSYIMELFDKNGIEVESRAEILYTSSFMEDNNLMSYTKMYYKTSIKLSPPLYNQDLDDIKTFFKINKYLKTIHFDVCNTKSLDEIHEILKTYRRKNIRIQIHDNITNKDTIEELKKRKKLFQKNRIDLNLKYTEEYVNNNLAKQIIITTITICALIALLILGGTTLYVLFNNMESEKNIKIITEQIENKITEDNLKLAEEQKEETPKQEQEDNKDDNTTKVPLIDPNKKQMLAKMASVKELNEDTVGWITVPGTNIDYPVVQTTNNDFYLNHNFNKEKDYNGWVFMNYFNIPDELDKNTILFAHNRYYSGVMFGTLNKVTKKDWYENYKDNLITFNTLYEELQWEVFSIYSIDVTNDYLKSMFKNNDEFLEFANMLKERSIFKSDTEIGINDKILTLSTCLDNDRRLVVHAVLKQL